MGQFPPWHCHHMMLPFTILKIEDRGRSHGFTSLRKMTTVSLLYYLWNGYFKQGWNTSSTLKHRSTQAKFQECLHVVFIALFDRTGEEQQQTRREREREREKTCSKGPQAGINLSCCTEDTASGVHALHVELLGHHSNVSLHSTHEWYYFPTKQCVYCWG